MNSASRTEVFCRLTFEGFHRWPDAPDEVAFLRDAHRHVFHVEVRVPVEHDERDVEFILLKRHVLDLIAGIQLDGTCGDWSCETWARVILNATGASSVTVSEDGENGATVYA